MTGRSSRLTAMRSSSHPQRTASNCRSARATAMPEIVFPATPTQRAFIESKAFINFLMGPRGEGKGQVNDALTLTPTGWVKAGDLRVGDRAISIDGTSTEIIGVYPQPFKPIYRLYFSDGSSADVTDDHLWAVETKWDRDGGAAMDSRDRTGRGKGLRCSPRVKRIWR